LKTGYVSSLEGNFEDDEYERLPFVTHGKVTPTKNTKYIKILLMVQKSQTTT